MKFKLDLYQRSKNTQHVRFSGSSLGSIRKKSISQTGNPSKPQSNWILEGLSSYGAKFIGYFTLDHQIEYRNALLKKKVLIKTIQANRLI